MRYLTLLLCAMSASAYAQVFTVFIWDAPTGHDAQMYETAMKAKALHEKMGAGVFIGTDQRGRMHYGVTYDSAEARGKVADAMPGNKEFQALMQAASQQEGAASLVTVHNLNTAVAGSGGNGPVTMVFQWRPHAGQMGAFIARASEAKKIHEKLGADVSIEIDEKGHAFYAINFASWTAQGKFADTLANNEAWSAFLAENAKHPIAEQVDTYRIAMMP